MLGFKKRRGLNADKLVKAIDQSLAVITFDPKGNILSANGNFCKALGYEADEMVGRHHSMFVDSVYANSEAYRAFWTKLGRGEFDSSEYLRIGKGGKQVWIQATYNPVLDSRGRVHSVVKLATDVTADKARRAATDAKVAADSGIAVIDFTTDGEILSANEVFLRMTGYSLDEIQGRHHRMFVQPAYASSKEYQNLWRELNAGHPVAGAFERVGKGGKEVALHASYTPVFDGGGNVFKITKMATDVTGRVHAVKVLSLALEELASNNLGYRMTETLDPMFERLRFNYNKAAEQLETAIKGIVANTAAIRSGTTEIAQAADDLSHRTERQASTLEQTTAALKEITATVALSASAAKQAGDAVTQAREKAKESSVIVTDAISAMSSIDQSAKQISQIIGVIDEIAFQPISSR